VKLSRDAKLLRTLLFVYIIADIFLTPLGGLETRPISQVTTTGYATLGLLFVGLALNIISLVMIFRTPRRSPVLAALGSALYFPAAIADAGGLFSNSTRPLGIAYVEVIEGVVAFAVIILAIRLNREKPERQTSPATTDS
jgi:hypothetical protein